MKKYFRVTGALVFAAVLTFVSANVLDYIRFTRAVNRANRLSKDELVALGDYAKTVTQERAVIPRETPPAFQPLRPAKVTIFPGCSYASLYQLGEIYLEFRIDTSPHNQHIYFFTNSDGPQKTKMLWVRDPSLDATLSPTNRILTISRSALRERIEWIVLHDKIVVINRSPIVGEGDSLLASIPLSPPERAVIDAQIRSIPAEIRGKSFCDEAVADGVSLDIDFADDGKPGRDSIYLGNTWTDAIGPLIDCVSHRAPKEYPIVFKEYVTGERAYLEHPPITVMTWKDWRAKLAGHPQTPWWCVWRALIGRDNSNN